MGLTIKMPEMVIAKIEIIHIKVYPVLGKLA
jgi:hypothetical protein